MLHTSFLSSNLREFSHRFALPSCHRQERSLHSLSRVLSRERDLFLTMEKIATELRSVWQFPMVLETATGDEGDCGRTEFAFAVTP